MSDEAVERSRLTFCKRREAKENIAKLGSAKAFRPLALRVSTHLEHRRSRSSSSISVSEQVESVGRSFEVLVSSRSLLDLSKVGLSL